MSTKLIDLDRISVDGTQTRAELREQAVVEYAELVESGVVMEPAILFDDGEKLHLAAGFHRRAAYQRARKTQMPCVVRRGDKWDAIQFGIKDNLKHRGERLTNADRRHNIRLVLHQKPAMSDTAIAELCGTTHKTVGRYRGELESTGEIPRLRSRIGRDGRARNTENEGSESLRHPGEGHPLPVSNTGVGETSTGRQGKQGGAEPDMDHHSCGGAWASDGEGGRYCEKCMVSYPENREPYSNLVGDDGRNSANARDGEPDPFLDPPDEVKDDTVSQVGPTAKPDKRELFHEARKRLSYFIAALDKIAHVYPGPCYPLSVKAAKDIGPILNTWERDES